MTKKQLLERADEFEGNEFFSFLQAMTQSTFREVNGKGLAIIEPGNFDVLVETGKELSFNFTQADAMDVIGELNEETLDKKGFPPHSLAFLTDWVNSARDK